MGDLLDRRATPVVAVLLLVGVYVAMMLPTVAAPFGDSHDGRNAGTWGAGTRALRTDGPIDSVLGARHQDGTVYANHPPALLTVTAISEGVGGEHPASTRTPALLASVTAVPLLYLLLRALALGRGAALLGTAVAVSTPMFRTFGAMVDTPILGLPVGLAVLLAWARAREGRPLPRPAEAAIGVAAGLVAWQCAFAVLIVGVAGGHRRNRALLGGTAVGLALTMVWIAAAYRGFGALGDVFLKRTGSGEGFGLGTALSKQGGWLPDLLGLGTVGVLAAVLALADARHRVPAAVVLASSFGWGVLMTDAAAIHSYWLYWAIVPASFGAAWLVAALRSATFPMTALPERLRPVAAVAAGAALLAGAGVTSLIQGSERSGEAAGALIQHADYPDGQDDLPLVGVISPPTSWIEYRTGLPSVPLTTPAAIRQLAAAHPKQLVLVSAWCPTGPDGDTCRDVVDPAPMWARNYHLVPAADLARRLDS